MPTIANEKLPPSGEQYEIGYGHHRVVVTEVGAALRVFSASGRDVIDGFDVSERCCRRSRAGARTLAEPSWRRSLHIRGMLRLPRPSTNLSITTRSMDWSAGCRGRCSDKRRMW